MGTGGRSHCFGYLSPSTCWVGLFVPCCWCSDSPLKPVLGLRWGLPLPLGARQPSEGIVSHYERLPGHSVVGGIFLVLPFYVPWVALCGHVPLRRWVVVASWGLVMLMRMCMGKVVVFENRPGKGLWSSYPPYSKSVWSVSTVVYPPLLKTGSSSTWGRLTPPTKRPPGV